MQNYDELIREELQLGTPKENYDYLIDLKKMNSKMRFQLTSLRPLIDGLNGTPDSATIEHLRVFIDSMKRIIDR